VAERKITVTMHRALKAAKDEPSGQVTGADNGVITALLRRGLARFEDGKAMLTDAGSFAVDHAPLDPSSQPSSMTLGEFNAYLRSGGPTDADHRAAEDDPHGQALLERQDRLNEQSYRMLLRTSPTSRAARTWTTPASRT
jgi:hypothetical protein